jgi:hypothetical protein
MVGSATLAMVVSSTCMKVASDRPMVVSSRLGVNCAGCLAHRCAVLPLALLSWISRAIRLSASTSWRSYTWVL